MKIILLGAPGSGKGTIAERLVRDFGLQYFSTGDIFRKEIAEKSKIGLLAKSYMDTGDLVSDQVTIEIIKKNITGKENFILDGYPRTIEQAEAIKAVGIDVVLYIEVSESSVVKRLSERRQDPQTGKWYHLTFVPPPEETKPRLIQRQDDAPTTVRQRFATYEKKTKPLVEYYEKKKLLVHINGEGTPEEVYAAVKKVVGNFVRKRVQTKRTKTGSITKQYTTSSKKKA